MPNTSSMSASQEISLLKGAHKLNRLITSMGFELPLRLLAYDCMQTLSPIGLMLLGYDVHTVNSAPLTPQHLDQYGEMVEKLPTVEVQTLAKFSQQKEPPFDVVLMNGLTLTELRTDQQLQEICQQLADLMKADGLLIITPADFDETLRMKERSLRPRIIETDAGRHIHSTVRDWHGNGYEFTETHYLIEHHGEQPTVTHYKLQRRAWRRAEITLALTQAGLEDVQWQVDPQNQRIMTARNVSGGGSN